MGKLFNKFRKYLWHPLREITSCRVSQYFHLTVSGSTSIAEKRRVGSLEALITCRLSRKLGFFKLIRGARERATRILQRLRGLIKVIDKTY